MNGRNREKTGKRGGQVRDERLVYTASFTVNRSDLLLEFLLRKCKTSRNNVKSLLAKGQVLVNGSAVTQYDFPLAKDDEVKISKNPVLGSNAGKRKTAERKAPRREKLKILFENEEFLAIDKPAGLLSVESDKETECAYRYALEYLRTQDKKARPYILHRIDKETSGVLLFAKNPKIHSILKMKWNEQVTNREYIAIAEGVFEEKTGTLVGYLKENKNNLMYVTNDPTGQKAITHFEVIAEIGQYSTLRVKIDTGRKNQIRVQFHAIAHPIVGDDKYGERKRSPLGRLGLHASKLEFIHPLTKEIMSFNAPLPPSFREFL